MKKILALVLALGATALLACPMQCGMNNGPMMGTCMMQKCQCDTTKLPVAFEGLDLTDAQKGQVQKIREDGKAFHNKQHDKMMQVLTPDQRKKFESTVPSMCPKGNMPMPAAGMGCKNCDKK